MKQKRYATAGEENKNVAAIGRWASGSAIPVVHSFRIEERKARITTDIHSSNHVYLEVNLTTSQIVRVHVVPISWQFLCLQGNLNWLHRYSYLRTHVCP